MLSSSSEAGVFQIILGYWLQAVKVALELKKHLVDNGLLDISQVHFCCGNHEASVLLHR